MARELARLGHRVEVVTARYGKLPRLTRSRNVLVRRLPALRRRPGQSNPLEMLSYAAVAAPYLLLRPGPKPDVVVSFHSIPSGLAAFPLSVLRGVPHIVLFRGGDVPGWLPERMAFYHRASLPLNRLIVHSASEALANSEGLRALAQPSFPRKKVGVLLNGVDLHEFIPRVEPPPAGAAPRLVFVGRITEQKGIDVLLQALASPALKRRDWHLDIAGDGPRLAEYVELAKGQGLIDRVTFHGWLTRAEVKRLYGMADMLVFPSRYEGMPNAVLEATACGLPVIATRVAGTEQIIEHGTNGLLIGVDDGEALASSIQQLLDDPARRGRMGLEARRLAEERWSWRARAKELEEVIARVTR